MRRFRGMSSLPVQHVPHYYFSKQRLRKDWGQSGGQVGLQTMRVLSKHLGLPRRMRFWGSCMSEHRWWIPRLNQTRIWPISYIIGAYNEQSQRTKPAVAGFVLVKSEIRILLTWVLGGTE